MRALLIRAILWIAVTTDVYKLCAHFGWSQWLTLIFAVATLLAYVLIAIRNDNKTLNDKAAK